MSNTPTAPALHINPLGKHSLRGIAGSILMPNRGQSSQISEANGTLCCEACGNRDNNVWHGFEWAPKDLINPHAQRVTLTDVVLCPVCKQLKPAVVAFAVLHMHQWGRPAPWLEMVIEDAEIRREIMIKRDGTRVKKP